MRQAVSFPFFSLPCPLRSLAASLHPYLRSHVLSIGSRTLVQAGANRQKARLEHLFLRITYHTVLLWLVEAGF